jgi:hypothetical protein
MRRHLACLGIVSLIGCSQSTTAPGAAGAAPITPVRSASDAGAAEAAVPSPTPSPPVTPTPPPEDAAVAAPDTAMLADAAEMADAKIPDSAPASGLGALSDDFSGAAIDSAWQIINAGKIDVTVTGGALHVRPTQSLLWFNASQGALIHKTVTGDFKVTATVHARKRTDPTQAPSTRIHLGGLMARDPDGPPENYVFIVVGIDVDDQSVETKTTIKGASTYVGPSWPVPDADLRICRSGAQFRLYKRAPGAAAWTLATSYQRPDLPATLQVGPNVYAPTARPDLDVAFEQVDFAPVASPDDCTRD